MLAYLLGLFYLNNIMLYLAPAEDPDELDMSGMKDGEFTLPVRETDEYKGFQRKMHELDFWKEMMSATMVAAFFSCF